jgi:hypothetical protein
VHSVEAPAIMAGMRLLRARPRVHVPIVEAHLIGKHTRDGRTQRLQQLRDTRRIEGVDVEVDDWGSAAGSD